MGGCRRVGPGTKPERTLTVWFTLCICPHHETGRQCPKSLPLKISLQSSGGLLEGDAVAELL
jgi:hypothetical protein